MHLLSKTDRWTKVLGPHLPKICHFKDVLSSQSHSTVMNKLNQIQQKQTRINKTTDIVMQNKT